MWTPIKAEAGEYRRRSLCVMAALVVVLSGGSFSTPAACLGLSWRRAGTVDVCDCVPVDAVCDAALRTTWGGGSSSGGGCGGGGGSGGDEYFFLERRRTGACGLRGAVMPLLLLVRCSWYMFWHALEFYRSRGVARG